MTNKWLIFGLTELGLVIPTVFIFVLGNFMGGIIVSNDEFGAIYTDGGVEALIYACMTPSGLGKFACTIFTLSFSKLFLLALSLHMLTIPPIVATMAAIIYSSALSVQLWGNHFMAVPRSIWTTVLAAICLVLAWGGRNILETVLSNFLSMLGYWVVGFVGCMVIEHYYFRPRNDGYDVDAWQDPKKMPPGLAGVVTMLTGYGMSFIGMVQTWVRILL
jgi:purine-cytosine permease-like protein